MHCGTAIWTDWCRFASPPPIVDVCGRTTSIPGIDAWVDVSAGRRVEEFILFDVLVEEFILFDVLYEDGTRTSNRKVPGSELGEVDGDQLAKTYIEAQDRQIAKISGKPHPCRIEKLA
jgi:hypothetical protein